MIIDGVQETIETNKGSYQIILKNGKKVFVKNLKSSIVPELEGYNMIKMYYNVPKLLDYDLVNSSITYDYNEGLKNNTLHHALFNNVYVDIDKIVNLLTFRFKDFEFKNENLSVNSKFFIGRLSEIVKYLESNDELYHKKLFYNNVYLGTFKSIVRQVVEGISQNNIVPFVISQGDPTDLNISTNYMVSDYEVAGKNSIINEVAIFVGCYIVNCYYYYIKYMHSPHAKFKTTLEKYNNYVKCTYLCEDDKLIVNFRQIIPSNVKNLILKYLIKVRDIGIIHPKFNLGVYIALRFMSPVNINKIKKVDDKLILMVLSGLFVKKYKTINQIIKFVKEI